MLSHHSHCPIPKRKLLSLGWSQSDFFKEISCFLSVGVRLFGTKQGCLWPRVPWNPLILLQNPLQCVRLTWQAVGMALLQGAQGNRCVCFFQFHFFPHFAVNPSTYLYVDASPPHLELCELSSLSEIQIQGNTSGGQHPDSNLGIL